MSAFMVSTVHIDALITAGLEDPAAGPLRWFFPALDRTKGYLEHEGSRRELTYESAGRVGAMLLAENVRSVNHRYSEDELEEPYLFTRLAGTADPVQVLKAVDCYEYQACEHDEWPTSEAAAFCDALRRRMVHRIAGYETAAWEINDPDVFLTAAARRQQQ
jgi:hypothetical protein